MMAHDAMQFLIQVHLHVKQVNLFHLIGRFLKSNYQRPVETVYFWSCFPPLPSYNCQPVAAGTTMSDMYKVEWVFVSFKWLSPGFIRLIRSNCSWNCQHVKRGCFAKRCMFQTFLYYPGICLLLFFFFFISLISHKSYNVILVKYNVYSLLIMGSSLKAL